jgi:hypothetical protein
MFIDETKDTRSYRGEEYAVLIPALKHYYLELYANLKLKEESIAFAAQILMRSLVDLNVPSRELRALVLVSAYLGIKMHERDEVLPPLYQMITENANSTAL